METKGQVSQSAPAFDPKPMALKVGVMGGASDVSSSEHGEKAHLLGQAIAELGCILLTGACPGLPLAAACGAKQRGGLVLGISPAANLQEHIDRFASPTEFHDILVFTGNGLMGREVINIRSSDIVVILGGRSGTLGELAIAYDEGKLIGVLMGMGGISEIIADIIAACAKDTGARVIYDADPCRLVEELIRLHKIPAAARSESADFRVTVRDPVCGMYILPQAAVAERIWQDCPYKFCSTECCNRFDADPQQYVQGQPLGQQDSR